MLDQHQKRMEEVLEQHQTMVGGAGVMSTEGEEMVLEQHQGIDCTLEFIRVYIFNDVHDFFGRRH